MQQVQPRIRVEDIEEEARAELLPSLNYSRTRPEDCVITLILSGNFSLSRGCCKECMYCGTAWCRIIKELLVNQVEGASEL